VRAERLAQIGVEDQVLRREIEAMLAVDAREGCSGRDSG